MFTRFPKTVVFYKLVGLLLIVLLTACAQATPTQEPVSQPTVQQTEEVAPAQVTEEVKPAETEAPAEPTVPPTPEPAAEPYTVEWWSQPRGDEADAMLDEKFVKPFNDTHETTQLNMVRRENHEEIVRMALQARSAPDIVQTNGPAEVVELAQAGLLVPLDQYAEKYGWEKAMLPWAFQAGYVDGKLYSVPLQYESILLYYNAKLFEENGWEPPTSVEDIEFLCQEALKLDKICFASSTYGKVTVNEWWEGWVVNAYAGPDKVYQALKGELPWTDQSFTDAVEIIRSWIADKGYFQADLDRYFTVTSDDNWVALAAGDAIMRVAGSWDLKRLESFCPEDCEWVVAPSLNPDVNPHYQLAIGESLSISADSKNPDAAAEVLDFIFNDRVRAAEIIEGFNFESWVVPLEWKASDFSPEALPRNVSFLEDFSKLTGQGHFGFTSWTFFPPETRLYFNEGFESLLLGDITLDEYMSTLQQLFEGEKDSVPPLPKPVGVE